MRPERVTFDNADLAARVAAMRQLVDATPTIKADAEPSAQAMDWSALAGREPPPRDWLCEQWITGGLTLFAGRGGIGKSLLSQQWATAVALGRSFVGPVGRARRGLVWNCEDDHDELWRRQVAICKAFGVTLRELTDRLFVVPRAGKDNVMMSIAYGAPTPTAVIAELAKQATDTGAEFVVLDNTACVFAANNNDPGHVRMFVNALAGALQGRPVQLIGHTARALGSEFAGSVQWEAAARTRLYLGSTLPDQQGEDEPAEDGVVFLSRRKANYSPKDWVKLTFTDGSFACEAADGSGLSHELRTLQARRVVLHGFDKLLAMGKQPTDSPTSPEYLPKLIGAHKLNEGLGKKPLVDAMRALMTDGKFRVDVVGQWANRQPRKGLVKC